MDAATADPREGDAGAEPLALVATALASATLADAAAATASAPPPECIASATLSAGGVRWAEKQRTATCGFADTVAELAIAKYRALLAQTRVKCDDGDGVEDETDASRQTVLASFVLATEPAEEGGAGSPRPRQRPRLKVVALGKGTKFIRVKDLVEDEGRGLRVHDCHAEVLARRSLKRFLARALEHDEEGIFETAGNGRMRLRKGVTLHFYTSATPCGNSAIRRWASARQEVPVRGFADKPLACPPPELTPHQPIFLSCRAEGQIAASVKREIAVADSSVADADVDAYADTDTDADAETDADARSSAGASSSGGPSAGLERPDPATLSGSATVVPATAVSATAVVSHSTLPATHGPTLQQQQPKHTQQQQKKKKKQQQQQQQQQKQKQAALAKPQFAVGTAAPGCGQGRILSCSDKMACWNAVGVQGRALAAFLEPVYVRSVTVGHKFSRTHLHRALCCRLQELPALGAFRLRHPSVLCTSVKLNAGNVRQTTVANFSDAECHYWSAGDEALSAVDGNSGTARGVRGSAGLGEGRADAVAHIASSRLMADVARLARPVGADAEDTAQHLAAFDETKRRALEIMHSRSVPSFAVRSGRRKAATPASSFSTN